MRQNSSRRVLHLMFDCPRFNSQTANAQIMKTTKILTLNNTLMAAALMLLPAPPANAGTFSDSFSEDTLNPFWWTVDTSSGNCTVAITNGSLVMTQGSIGQAFLNFNPLLPGDLSATVDYSLLNWPYNNGERIGLRTSIGAVERISDNNFGGEMYVTDVNSTINITPTSDSSGTLKLQRTGTVTTGFYLHNGSWTQIGSTDSHNSADCLISLSIWPAGITPGVQVAFGNFTVTAPGWAAVPQLAITQSGANVILTWPTNDTGFILKSTTDLLATTFWNTVSPAPVVINGKNTVTNSISDSWRFYRLTDRKLLFMRPQVLDATRVRSRFRCVVGTHLAPD
jgi:hypothetical protein